jgi:hypothetical protein
VLRMCWQVRQLEESSLLPTTFDPSLALLGAGRDKVAEGDVIGLTAGPGTGNEPGEREEEEEEQGAEFHSFAGDASEQMRKKVAGRLSHMWAGR